MAEHVFWYEHLTAEQSKQLVEFRRLLQQENLQVPGLEDNLTLLRFLKARQWTPCRALKMYEAMASWRAEHRVNEFVDRFDFHEQPVVRTIYPHCYHKTDKWGRPVYYELLGRVDVDRLMEVTTLERFIKYHIQMCEVFRTQKLPACSVAAGHPILTTTVVLDLEGLNMPKAMGGAVKSMLAAVAKIDQDIYPEHLGTMVIINAPVLFRSLWICIKPFLDERTLVKIKVLGRDYRAALRELIPAENLPIHLGGTSVFDPMRDEGPWALWDGKAVNALAASAPGDAASATGEAVGLIRAAYPSSKSDEDAGVRWSDAASEYHTAASSACSSRRVSAAGVAAVVAGKAELGGALQPSLFSAHAANGKERGGPLSIAQRRQPGCWVCCRRQA